MKKRPSDHGGILTPQMACYHAVHDYPLGLPGIAQLIDRTPDTLRKKLNPANDTHNLLFDEAMHILRITRDSRILDAICAEGDAVWFRPEEVPAAPADLDVLRSSTSLMERAVSVISELEKALADGEIDSEERARLDKAFLRLNQSAFHVSETARKFQQDEE